MQQDVRDHSFFFGGLVVVLAAARFHFSTTTNFDDTVRNEKCKCCGRGVVVGAAMMRRNIHHSRATATSSILLGISMRQCAPARTQARRHPRPSIIAALLLAVSVSRCFYQDLLTLCLTARARQRPRTQRSQKGKPLQQLARLAGQAATHTAWSHRAPKKRHGAARRHIPAAAG